MRRSNLSLVTAAIVLACALAWLSMNMAARGVVWVAIALVWLITAAIQRFRHDDVEPYAGRRLLRRFSRLLLFWC